MKKTIVAVLFGAMSLITWGVYAQNLYFQTPTAEEVCEKQWEEEAENQAAQECNQCAQEEQEDCCCQPRPRYHRWKEDYHEEEHAQDTGWPSQRDNEFSDQLSR